MNNITKSLCILSEGAEAVPLDSILGRAHLPSLLPKRKTGENNVLYNGNPAELWARPINSNDIDKRGYDFMLQVGEKQVVIGTALKPEKIQVLKSSALYGALTKKHSEKPKDDYGYGKGRYMGD